MTESADALDSEAVRPQWLIPIAGWCAYLSGIVSVFGIACLVALYVILFAYGEDVGFGRLNDVSVIIHYSLTLPIALVLRQLLHQNGPRLSLIGLLLGVSGMVSVIVLQALLVVSVLSFGQQVGFVILAFVPIVGWFVINGRLGDSSDIPPGSMCLQVLAGLYFGYPIWAFSLGRRLLALRN
jgi:hypothetical protein